MLFVRQVAKQFLKQTTANREWPRTDTSFLRCNRRCDFRHGEGYLFRRNCSYPFPRVEVSSCVMHCCFRGNTKMILSGWKEIARYLGRGVRTVQRWEQLGLPVRRPNSRLRSSVLVNTEQIDTWLSQCGNGRDARISHTASASPNNTSEASKDSLG